MLRRKEAGGLLLFVIVGLARGQTGPECPRKCTCDYYSAVHTIDCSTQDFKQFPDRIPTWTTSLSFDGNFLRRLNLSSFNSTVYFEKFRIRYNEIERIALERDRSRDRSGARGSCTESGRIFPRLVDVNLRGNRLRKLPKCLLSVWPKLKSLNLDENRIASINSLHLLGHFYHYQSIETLRLRRNFIEYLRKRDWYSPASALGRVRILDLSENRITRIERDVFRFLKELRELQLPGNRIRSIPNFAFSTIGKNVENINLSNNIIRSIAPMGFAGLPRLTLLDLRGNRIRCLSANKLSSCLVPPRPPPTGVPVDLRGLRQLRLEGNPWKCGCELRETTSDQASDVIASSFGDVRCAGPPRYRGMRLRAIARRMGNCTTE